MDRTEILNLATSASEGNRKALTRFKEVALAAGFVGGAGGWISHHGGRNVVQGWAGLASRAKSAGWVLETLVTTVIQAELDRTEPATFPAVESVAPDARTSVSVPQDLVELAAERTGGGASLAAVAEAIADQGELPGMWHASDLFGGEADMGGPAYGLEVLKPLSGVARVAVTDLGNGDRRVQVFHGDNALQDATSAMIKYNQGTEAPPEPVEPKVHPGDVVTIHRGHRRYQVLRVELDSFMNGERCDYARLSPCDPYAEKDPGWVSMDLLHVVEPVARLTAVVVHGILVTDELVALGAFSATETEPRRIALIQDPAAGAAGLTALLVDPRFPKGSMPEAKEAVEIPVIYPGDAVVIERPSGNALYRWYPDAGDQDALLANVTYLDRHGWTS